MRNIFVFLGALLLVDGAFGVDETLSVMEGDSVTLKPPTEILEDDSALWKFGEEIIARINKAAGLFSISEGDVRFKDRLKLDHQTGSLTITNIRTDHTGLYKLQIRGDTETFNIFSVTVRDVVKSLSVMEGDSVTLHTGVIKKQRDDQIQWKFGDPGVLIADLKGPDGARWRNLNTENGEITTSNIRRNQSGDYKLEINTINMILHRKLRITISDKVTTVSVKERDTITLDTGLVEIQGYDVMWKFGDQLIAEINKETNQFLIHDTSDKRFKGRLQRYPQSGSLTISDSRTKDTGDYHLNMNSSTHTVQRIISVTVSVSDLQVPDSRSSGSVSGISGASVGLMLWAVTVFFYCMK